MDRDREIAELKARLAALEAADKQQPADQFSQLPSATVPAKPGATNIVLIISSVVLALILLVLISILLSRNAGSSNAVPDNGAVASPGSTAPQATAAPEAAAPEAATPQAPAIDLSDAKALDDKYSDNANASCDVGADDYLRDVARFDFKWDDDTHGFFGMKFDQFLAKTSSPGVITLVSDRLMLQNGFGAYARAELYCRYDTQNDKVLGYSVSQPGD